MIRDLCENNRLLKWSLANNQWSPNSLSKAPLWHSKPVLCVGVSWVCWEKQIVDYRLVLTNFIAFISAFLVNVTKTTSGQCDQKLLKLYFWKVVFLFYKS